MNVETFEYRTSHAVEVLSDVPAQGRVISFRRKRAASTTGLSLETGGQCGELFIEVTTAKGEPWVGCFEPGPGGLSGLFATPSPSTLCVAMEGQAYWVPVLAPHSFEVIPLCPIKHIMPVPDADTIVFADFTRLAGYGADGRKWLTDDLSWDGLKIVQVTPTTVHGLGWDSPKNCDVEFTVDVQTGSASGGSSPPKRG